MKRLSLDDPPFANKSGRGIRVAVVDSGVHPDHPHLGGSVAGGTAVLPGVDPKDWIDRIGHGTAVAAAIHQKAPSATILSVRVFDRALTTSPRALADGIVWSADHGADLINLSLGTSNPAHRDLLADALAHAVRRGSTVVSAMDWDGRSWLPGSLDGATGVMLDWECERDEIGVIDGTMPSMSYAASGFPRPIPGVPVGKNLSGISFAVANVTGFLARMLEH